MARNVREIGQEMDQKVKDLDVDLQEQRRYTDRFCKGGNELKEEYAVKLAVYKQGLHKKPKQLAGKFKPKEKTQKKLC